MMMMITHLAEKSKSTRKKKVFQTSAHNLCKEVRHLSNPNRDLPALPHVANLHDSISVKRCHFAVQRVAGVRIQDMGFRPLLLRVNFVYLQISQAFFRTRTTHADFADAHR